MVTIGVCVILLSADKSNDVAMAAIMLSVLMMVNKAFAIFLTMLSVVMLIAVAMAPIVLIYLAKCHSNVCHYGDCCGAVSGNSFVSVSVSICSNKKFHRFKALQINSITLFHLSSAACAIKIS
jgi:hypothetical protein